jgi:PAT family beta-lactamase induction signal transducer AmpG
MPALSRPLPALTDHKTLRLAALALLYCAQGLPIGLFQVAIPAYMASLGMTVAEVGGFIAFVFLPWSFKLVAGPIMDRFTFAPMGNRRPWVLSAQGGLLFSFALLALLHPEPASQYWALAGLGFLSNVFSALQDVAVDGLAVDILKADERAQGNAFMYGGQMAGISLSGALSSWALADQGLTLAASLMALCVLLILLVPLLIREHPGERLLPWSTGVERPQDRRAGPKNWRAIVIGLFRAIVLPMSLLLIFIEACNRITSGVLISLAPIVTVQDLGWTQLAYANWIALTGVTAAVLGVLCSPWIDRIGALRVLKWIVMFRVVMFALTAALEPYWGIHQVFEAFLMINAVATQLVTVTLIALFMRLCSQRVAASQFAVYMALANMTYSLGSGLMVPLSHWTHPAGIMLFCAILIALMWLLIHWVNFERHDLDLSRLD